MTPLEWTTLAREAGWVRRHPEVVAYVVHLLAAAGVITGGLGTSTQNMIVDGVCALASVVAQLAASHSSVATGRDGALLLPPGSLAGPTGDHVSS